MSHIRDFGVGHFVFKGPGEVDEGAVKLHFGLWDRVWLAVISFRTSAPLFDWTTLLHNDSALYLVVEPCRVFLSRG